MFERLHAILNETTVQLRKGGQAALTVTTSRGAADDPAASRAAGQIAALAITEIFAMPSEDAALDMEMVDVHFVTIGVDLIKAEAARDELIDILDNWPTDELEGGPSFISVGGTIGDQGAALQLFALGHALGLWTVVTPAALGLTGAEAEAAAGNGFVMTTGYMSPKLSA